MPSINHTELNFKMKREIFSLIFGLCLFLFIIFLIPIDFLFRISTLWLSFSVWELLYNLSFVILFFTVLSFLIAAFVASLTWILALISLRSAYIIYLLVIIIGCYFLSICFAQVINFWLINVTGLQVQLNFLVFLSIVLTSISIFWKRKTFWQSIRYLNLKSIKFNRIVILMSFILVSINIFHGWFTSKNNNNYIKSPRSISESSKLPNIIIVSFDALKAGHTSLHGYAKKTTPNLEKLAQRSYVFQNMFSTSNWTVPSIASLLTGKYPHRHNLNELYYSHFRGREKVENLAYLLREQGYKTGAIVGNPVVIPWRISVEGFSEIDAEFRIDSPFLNAYLNFIPFNYSQNPKTITDSVRLTYEYGFQGSVWVLQIINTYLPFRMVDTLIQSFHERVLQHLPSQEKGMALRVFSADNLLGKASDFLMSNQGPVFLWVHLWSPHSPYMPRFGKDEKESLSDDQFWKKMINYYEKTFPIICRKNRYSFLEQPLVDSLSTFYDDNISYADQTFGRFVNFLDRNGFLDNSILIVTSDHGEMFSRHFWSHGGPYLYQPLTHIPLLIHLPGQVQGKKIENNTSLVDLAPTLLDLVDLKPPSWMDGQSVKDLLLGKKFETNPKFIMQLSFQNTPPDFQTFSLGYIKDNYKLIKYLQYNRYELYDLQRDPKEQHSLVQSQPETFLSLKGEMEKYGLEQNSKD